MQLLEVGGGDALDIAERSVDVRGVHVGAQLGSLRRQQPRLLARRRRCGAEAAAYRRHRGERVRAGPDPEQYPGTYGHPPVRQHAEGHAGRDPCGQEGAQVSELVVVEDVAARPGCHHRDVVTPPDRVSEDCGLLHPGHGARDRRHVVEGDGPVEGMDPAVGASPGDVGRLGILPTCHRQRVERAQQAGVSGRDRGHGLGRPVPRRPQAGPVAQLDRGAVRRARPDADPAPSLGVDLHGVRRVRHVRPAQVGQPRPEPSGHRQLGLRHAPVRRPGRDRLQPGQGSGRQRQHGSVRPVPHQRVDGRDPVADGRDVAEHDGRVELVAATQRRRHGDLGDRLPHGGRHLVAHPQHLHRLVVAPRGAGGGARPRLLGEDQPVPRCEQRRLGRRSAAGGRRRGQQVDGVRAGQRDAARRGRRRELRVEEGQRPAAAQPHHLVARLLEDPADEGVEERRQLVEARGVLRVVLTVAPAERLLEPGQGLRLAQRHLAQQGGDHLLRLREGPEPVRNGESQLRGLAELRAQRVVAVAADVGSTGVAELGQDVRRLLGLLPRTRRVACGERGDAAGLEPPAERVRERLQAWDDDLRCVLELLDRR